MRKSSGNKNNHLEKIDRRGFLVTSIAGGFALAVQPIQAQTKITTDAKGLIAGEVKIPVSGGEIPAYRAMPDTKGKKFPVVLVVHEIFGVHEWIQDICRRFAKLGFMAIAPALYARQGDVSKAKDFDQIIRGVVSKVPDSQVISDLDASIEFAKASGSGNAKKLSITGFCWGGRIVWLYAAHNSKVKAGAAWYGRLISPPNSPANELQPKMPIDFAKDIKVPVLGLYGGLDTGIPLDTVQRMQDDLKKGKSKSEIIVFPNAGHGFHADYRGSFNKQASEDAWRKMLAWFAKNKAS
jgi:carboxymethylenebutenolidase